MDHTGERRCKDCNVPFPLREFESPKGGHRKRCKYCHNRERRRYSLQKYYDNHEKEKSYRRGKYASHRESVLEKFGAKCECCGETTKAFLEVDHINNDGGKFRRTGTKSHINIYRWLVVNKFPPGFRLLCCNCNKGRFLNGGICPHQESSQTIAQASRGECPEVPETHSKRQDIVEPSGKPVADLAETFHDNPSWPLASERVQ